MNEAHTKRRQKIRYEDGNRVLESKEQRERESKLERQGIRVLAEGWATNQAEVYDGKKAYEDTR